VVVVGRQELVGSVQLRVPFEGGGVEPVLSATDRTEPHHPVIVDPGGSALRRHSQPVDDRVSDGEDALLARR
jgi:hypothetical protein